MDKLGPDFDMLSRKPGNSCFRRKKRRPISAGAHGGAAGDADRPPALADRVPVAPVGDVAEGQAALRIGPGDLAAGAVVAERAGRLRVPEPAPVGVPVVAGDDDAEGTVGGRSQRQRSRKVLRTRPVASARTSGSQSLSGLWRSAW